jgi:hypothetical protein
MRSPAGSQQPWQPNPWEAPEHAWAGNLGGLAPRAGVLPTFRPQPLRAHATNYESFYGASAEAVSAPEAHNWHRSGESTPQGSSWGPEQVEKGVEVDSPSKGATADANDTASKKSGGKRKGARAVSTQQAGGQAKKNRKADVGKVDEQAEEKGSERFAWTSKATKLLIFLTLNIEQEAVGQDEEGNKSKPDLKVRRVKWKLVATGMQLK